MIAQLLRGGLERHAAAQQVFRADNRVVLTYVPRESDEEQAA